MMVGEILAAFCLCIAAMSWASVRLTATLERIGARYGLSDGLLGVLIALGADAPEICSAIAALLSSEHEVGLGLVIGSNIFNLAGLLGLSAVVAGRITVGRKGLWLNGGVSLAVTVVVLALLFRLISVEASFAVLVLLLVPYFILTAKRPARFPGLRLPRAIGSFVHTAVTHFHHDARRRLVARTGSRWDLAWLVTSLAVIIASSFGAVHCAVWLGQRWGIDEAITGMLLLAALTSLPNVVAAVKLATDGLGAAVISESLNSNSLNIIAGIVLPALVIGFAAPESSVIYAAVWLFFMKAVTLWVAGRENGLSRTGGAVIIVMYLMFAAAVLTQT